MAKLRPTLTLAEMEEEMGFRLSEVSSSMTTTGRLYSNLRPVSSDLYERTEKEHEEFIRRRKHAKIDSAKGSSCISLRPGEIESVICGGDSIRLSHDGGAGSYRFLVDIHYGLGLDLALLFSEAEAARVLSTAKLHHPTAATRTSTWAPAFFYLPLEIRQKIYTFALPQGIWRTVDDQEFERDNFPRGVGDPSGFHYPLSKDLVVLRVNKQMRREALPFAYRRTAFCLDNLDGAIKFLIAVGQTGRENIEVLRLGWESALEFAYEWDIGTAPGQGLDQLSETLCPLRTSTCVQLLKQCKRLRYTVPDS